MPRIRDRFGSDAEHLDAIHDAAYDHFLTVAVQCAECDALHDPGYHQATRHEPGWVEREECPNCGSTAIKEG